MKFGILSQWFDPEPGAGIICGSLARELARRGHTVKVLTGFPNYPTGYLYPGFTLRPRQDSREMNFALRRVVLYPSHDSSPFRRLLNYSSFSLSASVLGLAFLKDVDAIWVYNSPASIAVPMWAAKGFFGVPHVLHIMDLWPDSVLMTDFAPSAHTSRTTFRILNAWCQAMYKSASAIAYVSPQMKEILLNRGVPTSRLHYIPVWANEEVSSPKVLRLSKEFNLRSDEFVILYAGALGPAQGLEPFLKALTLLDASTPVRCLIAGSGTSASSLKNLAQGWQLNNVHFLGQLPTDQISQLSQAVDLHLVSLRDSPLTYATMPSKIQGILHSGKPFIAVVNGDARTVAIESQAAFLASPGDPYSIAKAIQEAYRLGRDRLVSMGAAGEQYYRQHFATERGVDALERLLVMAAKDKKKR